MIEYVSKLIDAVWKSGLESIVNIRYLSFKKITFKLTNSQIKT